MPAGLHSGSDSFSVLQREFPFSEIDWNEYLETNAITEAEALRAAVRQAVAG